MDRLKHLWVKYEEIITYLIVGVMTTCVSWTAKFLANFILFDNTLYPTTLQATALSIINWTAGVIFAYFANRRFVFKSHAPMRTEAPKFVLSRVSTLIMDWIITVGLGALGVNVVIATIVSAVVVTVCNYIFSKLFVFSKGRKQQN